MTFDNLLGYILSISMCMQSFIRIVHSVRPFSLFQNLELATASTDVNGYAKFYQNTPKCSRDKASFTLFRICLFVLEFYGPVNNEIMSSRSVNSGTVPGQV